MSDVAFLKCACSYCQGRIEFPAHALGITTTCPHCGVETTLVGPPGTALPAAPKPATPASPPPPPPPQPLPPSAATVLTPVNAAVELLPASPASAGSKLKKILNVVWSVIVGLSVLTFVGLKLWNKYHKIDQAIEVVKGDPKPDKSKPAPTLPPAAPNPRPMPPPVAVPTSVVVAKGTPPPRKAGEDLQVLSFEVQRAKDGNLQYVIGVVTNHSGKQLFNVKIEFELSRADGKPGDLAMDSIRNLPANAGSPFKANIIGSAPVISAKLAKLEGEKE